MYQKAVLLVDDDAHVLSSISRMLAEESFDVYAAESGPEALKMLRSRNVQVIVADYGMPGMTGVELFKNTILDYPDIIRILLTGNADMKVAIQAINEGAVFKFILKPWNNEDLRITVKRSLELHELVSKNQELTSELQKRDALLNELERQHPGITKRPENGIYRLS